MTSAIRVDGLEKSYGNLAALRGVSFAVSKGEVFALLGANGAGKTTALACMEGLRVYDRGSIAIDGRVGIQLQTASLPDHIRPMEAVRLFAKWNKVKPDEAMLAALGIGDLAKKQYLTLSTGQKRRLHLALALLGNPDIVFLDEPTAGLDVQGRIALHAQIRRLKAAEKTIVLASHDMAEVEALCDRIAILRGGRLLFVGSVAQLHEKIGKHYTIHIKTTQTDESFEAENIGDTLLTLLEDFKRKGVAVLDIQISAGTLEQHFVAMTKEPAQ